MAEATVHRVPLEEVGEHLRRRQVVDSDDLDVASLCCDASHATPDAAKAIDSDFRRHCLDSLHAATRSEYAALDRGT